MINIAPILLICLSSISQKIRSFKLQQKVIKIFFCSKYCVLQKVTIVQLLHVQKINYFDLAFTVISNNWGGVTLPIRPALFHPSFSLRSNIIVVVIKLKDNKKTYICPQKHTHTHIHIWMNISTQYVCVKLTRIFPFYFLLFGNVFVN